MTVAGSVGHHGKGFSHRLQETEAAGLSERRDWLERFAQLQSNEHQALSQRNTAPSTASGTATEAFNRPGGEFPSSRSIKRPILHQTPVPPLPKLTHKLEPRGTPTFCFACSRLSPGRSFGRVSRSTFTLS